MSYESDLAALRAVWDDREARRPLAEALIANSPDHFRDYEAAGLGHIQMVGVVEGLRAARQDDEVLRAEAWILCRMEPPTPSST